MEEKDKIKALIENVEFLLGKYKEGGDKERLKDLEKRMKDYRELAVSIFYNLGEFSRDEILFDVWWEIHLFLRITVQTSGPSFFFGTDFGGFKEKAEKIRDRIENFCSVPDIGDKINYILGILFCVVMSGIVFFYANGAWVAFDTIPHTIIYKGPELYIIAMGIVCLIVVFFCWAVAGIWGAIIGSLVGFCIFYLPMVSIVARITISIICLIQAIILLPRIFITKRKLRKKKSLEEFMELLEERETLYEEVRPSLEALETFASIDADTIPGIFYSGMFDVDFPSVKKRANILISYYKEPVYEMDKVIRDQVERFENVGVKVPGK